MTKLKYIAKNKPHTFREGCVVDAKEAIRGGYTGAGQVAVQSVINFLLDGAEYAPCDLQEETRYLAHEIESRKWDKADSRISYFISAMRGIRLTEREVEWATAVGMAQKVVESQGLATQ